MMGGEDPLRKNEWDIWPEKASILIGTQDMLLSRALNRGYGMSRNRWPMHFGLLNNDCLWVADEVQLMGPGLWCTGQLDWMRQKRFEPTLPSWTWWMSATNSGGSFETPDRGSLRPQAFQFDESEMPPLLREARRPCEFWSAPAKPPQRKGRGKKAAAADAQSGDKLGSPLASAIAEGHQPGTLSLVVCNTVGTAQSLFEALIRLDRKGASLVLITSRFRKQDRASNQSELIDFERRRKAGNADGLPGLICVATQVVEAGVDVSACRLWSEVAPWPSAVQRLGRLNRDGGENRNARAYFFEASTRLAKGNRAAVVGPYSAQAMEAGTAIIAELVGLSIETPHASAVECLARLRTDDKTDVLIKEALRPARQPLPRAIDVHGLFSTEPDLFGGFTDVSQFVRGDDKNADVTVFWREFDPSKMGSAVVLNGPAYDPLEGCGVPIHRLRDFVETKSAAFVWDDQQSTWARFRHSEIFPGMVVMLPQSSGGYSCALGWTGRAGDRLETVPAPGVFEEDYQADFLTERGEWVSLEDHLRDVRLVSETIATNLGLPESHRLALLAAAAQHDVGKALPGWQDKLPYPPPREEKKWAKAPFLLAVHPASVDAAAVELILKKRGIRSCRATPVPGRKMNLDRHLWHTSERVADSSSSKPITEILALNGVKSAWMVPFRPGLRHEAGSALAMWHQYFHGVADFPALSIYLTAAHHGKVRTVLTSRSKQGNDVCGIPRFNTEIPWANGLTMDFSCAADGAAGEFTSDGSTFIYESPGWTALIADLLGGWQKRPETLDLLAIPNSSEPAYLGPFALSFLETLLRCADMRASQSPSEHIDV